MTTPHEQSLLLHQLTDSLLPGESVVICRNHLAPTLELLRSAVIGNQVHHASMTFANDYLEDCVCLEECLCSALEQMATELRNQTVKEDECQNS